MSHNHSYILFALLLLLTACDKNDEVRGCKDPNAVNYDPTASVDCSCCEMKKGKVILWAKSESPASACGLDITVEVYDGVHPAAITIILDTLTETEPINCESSKAYTQLSLGNYNWTAFPKENSPCEPSAGSFTVKEGCNKVLIY